MHISGVTVETNVLAKDSTFAHEQMTFGSWGVRMSIKAGGAGGCDVLETE